MSRPAFAGSEEEPSRTTAGPVSGSGSLKLFFAYARCSGATSAMVDEAKGLSASGRDVYMVALPGGSAAAESPAAPFDVDRVLQRRPDVAVLGDLSCPDGEGSRNRTRYQDAEELLRAGIDVYATLHVADLQNERDAVRALGVGVAAEPVPDYLIYEADQLEFVDIDPSELVSRQRLAGIDMGEEVLVALRVIALRCVSEHAAAAVRGRCADPSRTATGALPRVVAVLEPGAPPARVLLEAARIAAVESAGLEAVCVLDERPSFGSRLADQEYGLLKEQAEAMGYELTTLYGRDPVAIIGDYLLTQGATDLVAERRPASGARRLLSVFWPSLSERVVEELPVVNVHVVAGEGRSTAHAPLWSRVMPSGVNWKGVLFAIVSTVLGAALMRGLQRLGVAESVAFPLFMGTALATAAAARSYLPAVLATFLAALALDFTGLRPFGSLAIDHRASLFAFMAFTLVAALLALAVVRLGRRADRSEHRERRTQALFDLNRSMLYAHGPAEVADVALSVCVRLFERSVGVYLRDPFSTLAAGEHDRRSATVRAALGDLDVDSFDKLTEQAVAHWVFSNGEQAGAGTDTHEASDIFYLPLRSPEGLEGVLAVSCKKHPLSLADRSFLDLVADQVALALERQALAAKHRTDVQAMQVTRIRSRFVGAMVSSAAVTLDTLHAVGDALLGTDADDRDYRLFLERLVSDESARGRLMMGRIQRGVEAPPTSLCNVREEVSRAVDDVRSGLVDKVIDLEPGEPDSPIVADAALVRMAVKLVLEASTSYIAKRGIVSVAVRSYADRVDVVITDDRPPDVSPARSAAFETVQRAGEGGAPAFDESRARLLREALTDRAAVGGDPQSGIATLCRAIRLPECAARADGDFDGVLNRQRVLRFDRLEYGLYVAACIVHAHDGTIKQRYRLGGGAVVTLTFPRS